MNLLPPQNPSRPEVGVPRPAARGFEGSGGQGQEPGDLGGLLPDTLLINQVETSILETFINLSVSGC